MKEIGSIAKKAMKKKKNKIRLKSRLFKTLFNSETVRLQAVTQTKISSFLKTMTLKRKSSVRLSKTIF